MKNAIVTALALIASLAALNANATSPVLPEHQTILHVRVGGGMPVPGGLTSREISVTRSGEVNVYERFYNKDWNSNQPGEQNYYQLPSVAALDMLMIGQAIEQIKGGALVKTSEMGCMDAPGYSYSIHKGGPFTLGKEITIFERFNCLDAPLKDKRQRAAAQSLVDFMDQLLQQTYKKN